MGRGRDSEETDLKVIITEQIGGNVGLILGSWKRD